MGNLKEFLALIDYNIVHTHAENKDSLIGCSSICWRFGAETKRGSKIGSKILGWNIDTTIFSSKCLKFGNYRYKGQA